MTQTSRYMVTESDSEEQAIRHMRGYPHGATNCPICALEGEVRIEKAAAEVTEGDVNRMKAVLVDLRDHGTNTDTTPTVRGDESVGWWYSYLSRMDEGVRNAARRGLGES